jgi:hypothetical protein
MTAEVEAAEAAAVAAVAAEVGVEEVEETVACFPRHRPHLHRRSKQACSKEPMSKTKHACSCLSLQIPNLVTLPRGLRYDSSLFAFK